MQILFVLTFFCFFVSTFQQKYSFPKGINANAISISSDSWVVLEGTDSLWGLDLKLNVQWRINTTEQNLCPSISPCSIQTNIAFNEKYGLLFAIVLSNNRNQIPVPGTLFAINNLGIFVWNISLQLNANFGRIGLTSSSSLLFIGSSSNFFAVDPLTGNNLWTSEYNTKIYSMCLPGYFNQHIFASYSNQLIFCNCGSNFWVLDFKGRVQWIQPAAMSLLSIHFFDNQAITLDQNGQLCVWYFNNSNMWQKWCAVDQQAIGISTINEYNGDVVLLLSLSYFPDENVTLESFGQGGKKNWGPGPIATYTGSLRVILSALWGLDNNYYWAPGQAKMLYAISASGNILSAQKLDDDKLQVVTADENGFIYLVSNNYVMVMKKNI